MLYSISTNVSFNIIFLYIRKYNKGSPLYRRNQWILGGIDRTTSRRNIHKNINYHNKLLFKDKHSYVSVQKIRELELFYTG